jgi:tetratricopeptide (TPR) repeat protein
MKQTEKSNRLPLLGMLLTTILVLGGLYALRWWTINRADIYTQRALAAGAQGNWAEAETLGRQAEMAGAADVLNRLTYDRAASLFEAGDYEAARRLYAELGNYGESVRQIMACDYQKAVALAGSGDYEAARDLFLAVAGYEDALFQADLCRYTMAEQLLAAGDQEAARQNFLALGNFRDAPARAQALTKETRGEEEQDISTIHVPENTPEIIPIQEQLAAARDGLQSRRLAAGQGHALFLTEDGTVRAAGVNDRGQCDVQGWADVVAVAAGYAHSLGLTADGRVLAAGDNSCGQCDTGEWTDVVRIFCGPWDSFGLTADGSMLHCGFTDTSALTGWTGLSALASGNGILFALRENGTLLCSRPDQTVGWLDLCDLAAAGYNPVGLNKDGTLLSDRRDLSLWTDVVAIDSSAALLVGLKLDGTLLVEPLLPVNDELLSALRNETDIVGFSVAGTYVLLLHKDGTFTAPGASFDPGPFNG